MLRGGGGQILITFNSAPFFQKFILLTYIL